MASLSSKDINDIPATVYKVLKYSILFGVSISFLVLTVTSLLVRDTYWITKNPKFFVSEALIMGLLTSIPVLYISYIRDSESSSTKGFVLLFLKIVFIHVGFQLSGVYSVLFPESAAP